jgi:hypothetical protein
VKPTQTAELLRVLATHHVRFIVVGGVAAIIEGAPVTTLDLDVVYEATDDNVDRLAAALRSVNAHYRDLAGRRILPDEERLLTTRTNLMMTDLGPFDALTEIGDHERYGDLHDESALRAMGAFEVRVLKLDKVIETKEAANRDKDRAMLPVLRAARDMSRGR